VPPTAETAAALRELGSATLGESGARPMPARVKPVWAGAVVAAPAYPVRCTTGDNLAIHVAVARAPQGAALVVDVGTQRELGYWGRAGSTTVDLLSLDPSPIAGA
jgi:4-hydroxy-4-methyl-2-oxoglutarate aldolase